MQKKMVFAFVTFMSLVAFFSFGIPAGSVSAHGVSTLHKSSAQSPQTSSVGGCSEHTGGPYFSFEMGVCISDRGTSGAYVLPDVYVNAYPSGSFNCSLNIEIWQGGQRLLLISGYNCTDHHDVSPAYYVVPSGSCKSLHTSVWITYNGTFFRIGDSPTYTYCN